MAGGMIGGGRSYGSSALSAMQRYSSLDEKLKAEAEIANKQMDAAHTQAQVSGGMSGAMAGAYIGTQITPGWGTAIGAVVGGVAGAFGMDLF